MSRLKIRVANVFLMLMAFLMLFPLIVTVTNSFMSSSEIIDNYSSYDEEVNKDKLFSVKLIPRSVTIRQYYEVLIAKSKFLRMFWNSVFVVLPIVVGQVIISSMAAFVFAKVKFKGRDFLFFIYIIIMMMPFQVTLVPNYITLDKLGLIDRYLAIIFPGVFGAFGVFLLR